MRREKSPLFIRVAPELVEWNGMEKVSVTNSIWGVPAKAPIKVNDSGELLLRMEQHVREG